MSERVRRAVEAAEAHTLYIEGSLPGCDRDRVERALLDPTIDPGDLRYGDPTAFYGTEFARWLGGHAGRAMTFTATMDLMREIVLTQEMLAEEEIDWLPLLPHHLPAPCGFVLFPYGVECPVVIKPEEAGVTSGAITWDRWMVDGLLWTTSDNVARDGVADDPSDGIIVFPLTRNRGLDSDRPFHPKRPLPVGTLVASDLTAWAFDDPGETEWVSMADVHGRWSAHGLSLGGVDEIGPLVERLHALRWWTRSLAWSCWRWMTEEVWLDGELDRSTRRRLLRAKPVIHENAPEDGRVVIVDLRPERKEAAARGDADGEPPWWRSRWIVRGHWARRRYALLDEAGNRTGPVRGPGSAEGVTFEYRRVWIEPFEKGPDSAPLVLRERVGVVNR